MPPRFRAWRFLRPGVDAADELAGLGLTARGLVDMVDEEDSVRQAIFLLLSTVPGERVMRPDYGCDLHRLVFSPNDDTTAGLAMHYVRRAIDHWEPRVKVVRLDAGANPDRPEMLDILLEYQVRATQRLERATFALSLAGEEA